MCTQRFSVDLARNRSFQKSRSLIIRDQSSLSNLEALVCDSTGYTTTAVTAVTSLPQIQKHVIMDMMWALDTESTHRQGADQSEYHIESWS